MTPCVMQKNNKVGIILFVLQKNEYLCGRKDKPLSRRSITWVAMEASSSSMSITTTATRSRSSQWSTIWPNAVTGKEALSFDSREPHHRLVRSRTPSPRSLTPIPICACSATSLASIIRVPAMSLAALIYDMAIFPNRQSAYPSGLCSEMITRTVTSDFLKNTGGSQLCGPQVCEPKKKLYICSEKKDSSSWKNHSFMV